MGTSAKRKREKKLDFQKPKLKVGAPRPKATNSTSTSFTSKSITLKQQSLTSNSTTHSSSPTSLAHSLSLISSRNDSQRLSALHSLNSLVLTSPSPPPIPTILSKIQPLLLDASPDVRDQLLRLLRNLPAPELGPPDQTLLYIRAAVTHLSVAIRVSALDAMEWLLNVKGREVVACAGGWVRTLRMFENLLGWASETVPSAGVNVEKREERDGKWTAVRTSGATAASRPGGTKLLVKQLGVLGRVLDVGLRRGEGEKSGDGWPVRWAEAYSIPKKARAYDYLNLFGKVRDVEGEMYEGVEERREVFVELGMHVAFAKGVVEAKKEGGEVGRAAAMVEKALKLVGDVG